MLMNIVNLVINHLLGKATNGEVGSGIFANFNRSHIRKYLMIFAGLAGSLMLFVGGFLTVLLDMILTSREHAQLMLSPASIVGFTLIGISVLVMAVLFSRKIWKISPSMMQPENPSISPVQEAMAELIRDFVEERRLGREMATEQIMAAMTAAGREEPPRASAQTYTHPTTTPAFN